MWTSLSLLGFVVILSVRARTANADATCENTGASLSVYSNAVSDHILVKNMGRIKFTVTKIDVNSTMTSTVTVKPGSEASLPDACGGDVWMVESLCGDCMEVISVSNRTGTTVEISSDDAEEQCPGFQGTFAPRVMWETLPVGIFNVANGNKDYILGFSGTEDSTNDYETGEKKGPWGTKIIKRYTRAQLYNPDEGTFRRIDLNGHDWFCVGMTTLPDGRIVGIGGGPKGNNWKVSSFNPATLSWKRHAFCKNPHWYGTAVLVGDQVMVSSGQIGKLNSFWPRRFDSPEVSKPGFNFNKLMTWKVKNGMNYRGKIGTQKQWYPHQHVMKDGRILSHGPQNMMYSFDVGSETIIPVGKRNKEKEERESWGQTTIYYDKNKVLAFGGVDGWDDDTAPDLFVYKRAIIIDFEDPTNIITRATADLHFERAFANSVVLPTGEVLAVGGKNNTNQFDDTNSRYDVEMWNPKTEKWTLLASQELPRNYHSTALLLHDGRVFSGGGGYCGTCKKSVHINVTNHFESQIFSPPYLFNEDGTLADRPVIDSVDYTVQTMQSFSVVVSGAGADNIESFALVKHACVTHSISTDLRRLVLDIEEVTPQSSSYKYEVVATGNTHEFTRGLWFLFANNQAGVPSVAKTIKITS